LSYRRGHLEANEAGVPGLVLAHQKLGVALDLLLGKNEAILGGIPGKSFVLMVNEDLGGVAELAAFALGAFGLEVAQRCEGLLELAREAAAMEAEGREGAVGVDDVELDGGLLGRRVGGAVEEGGFEFGDAVEAPGGVGEFLDELRFGGSGGLVLVAEAAAVDFVGGAIFGRQDGGGGGEAMSEGVHGGTLFPGCGARAGGELGVGAIDGFVALEPAKDGVGSGCGHLRYLDDLDSTGARQLAGGGRWRWLRREGIEWQVAGDCYNFPQFRADPIFGKRTGMACRTETPLR